jgi:hypothetical protein
MAKIYIHAIPVDDLAERIEPIEVTDDVDEEMAKDALMGVAEPEQFIKGGKTELGKVEIPIEPKVKYYRHVCHGHGEPNPENKGCTMEEIK